MAHIKNITWFVILSFLLISCGGKDFKKAPIDDIIKDMESDKIFTIILHDMDVTGTFFHDYYHQYKIVTEVDGKAEEKITDLKEVSKDYFNMHVNNMGMEIAHRGEDGKLEKTVAPPGYSQYVGNSRYGHWSNSGGSSVWAFYGQYMFLSTMFNMNRYPVNRGYYNNYTSYRNSGRTYYGPTSGGSRYYGTGSTYNSGTRPNSSWSRNNSMFKRRVSGRTSRSTSRYGSSSRSSGGGFGK